MTKISLPDKAFLVFNYRRTECELETFVAAADQYISPEGVQSLRDFKAALGSFRDSRQKGEWDWVLAPMTTRFTSGYRRKSKNGKPKVFARVGCIWQIRDCEEKSPLHFALVGKASTVVQIFRSDQTHEAQKANRTEILIAEWRFEIGSGGGPGSCFHAQILGDERYDQRWPECFPQSIDNVPRLPSILVTPIDAIEFVLGELFQDRWHERATSPKAEIANWRAFQRDRIQRLLAWKQQELEQQTVGSPWAHLKIRWPDPDVFIRKAD